MTRLALGVKCGGRGVMGLSVERDRVPARVPGHGFCASADAGPGSLAVQKQRQGDGAHPGLRGLEELAAGLRPGLLQFQGQFRIHANQPLVNKASRFRSTLATVVQAARSAGSMSGGRGPSGSVARDTAAWRFWRYRSNSLL